jgi:hypothetical protein
MEKRVHSCPVAWVVAAPIALVQAGVVATVWPRVAWAGRAQSRRPAASAQCAGQQAWQVEERKLGVPRARCPPMAGESGAPGGWRDDREPLVLQRIDPQSFLPWRREPRSGSAKRRTKLPETEMPPSPGPAAPEVRRRALPERPAVRGPLRQKTTGA